MKTLTLFEQTKRISVSYKWASKYLNCTIQGITKTGGCGGACCRTKSFYPAKANGGKCIRLADEGCVYDLPSRPVKCLLYPFIIKNNKLVLYGRSIISTCKPCYNDGAKVTVYENLRANLTELFGAEQYERVYNDIIHKKKDSYFDLPTWWDEQIKKEDILEMANLNPEPRVLNNVNNA